MKLEYPIDRYAMETKRQLDLLDQHLAEHEYLAGEHYSIADIAVWPWYGELVNGDLYKAQAFLSVEQYTHVRRWADRVAQRPAVQRGRRVNLAWGDEAQQLHERHDASDFESKSAS